MTFKNAVQTNGDGGSNSCPMVIKYSIRSLLFMNKMLIYFVLPLEVSFSRNRQLKTSNFVKTFMFMTKMLIFSALPLMVSFSCKLLLKTSNFEKNVTFPDKGTDAAVLLTKKIRIPDTRTDTGTDRQNFFLNLNLYTYDSCQLFVSQTLS